MTAPGVPATRAGTVAGTEPYPWPYDGVLDASRIALVLTGWDAGWAGRVDPAAAQAATRAAGRLAAVADRTYAVACGAPARLAARATEAPMAPPDAVLLGAPGIDAFHGTALDHLLRAAGVDRLVIAGLGLETTVHSALRSANDRGYECLLVVDASAPHDLGCVAAAASMVQMSGGIFGAVGRADDVIAALSPGGTP